MHEWELQQSWFFSFKVMNKVQKVPYKNQRFPCLYFVSRVKNFDSLILWFPWTSLNFFESDQNPKKKDKTKVWFEVIKWEKGCWSLKEKHFTSGDLKEYSRILELNSIDMNFLEHFFLVWSWSAWSLGQLEYLYKIDFWFQKIPMYDVELHRMQQADWY